MRPDPRPPRRRSSGRTRSGFLENIGAISVWFGRVITEANLAGAHPRQHLNDFPARVGRNFPTWDMILELSSAIWGDTFIGGCSIPY